MWEVRTEQSEGNTLMNTNPYKSPYYHHPHQIDVVEVLNLLISVSKLVLTSSPRSCRPSPGARSSQTFAIRPGGWGERARTSSRHRTKSSWPCATSCVMGFDILGEPAKAPSRLHVLSSTDVRDARRLSRACRSASHPVRSDQGEMEENVTEPAKWCFLSQGKRRSPGVLTSGMFKMISSTTYIALEA